MVVRRVALVAALAVGLSACGQPKDPPVAAQQPAGKTAQVAAVKTPKELVDARLADRVLRFGDIFAAVAYHLSFTAEARDISATTSSCTTLLRSHRPLASALERVGAGNLGDVAKRLLGATAAVAHACADPSAIDPHIAEIVQLDFGAFRELAFDFSGLSSTTRA